MDFETLFNFFTFCINMLTALSLVVPFLLALSLTITSQAFIAPRAGDMSFVKDSGICETTEGVHQASGYVNIAPLDRMWFWFFEARHSPQDAPLTLWLNGGPGCSSMIGLFQEIGPCTVNEDESTTTLNPYSWTNVSNVLFVDQPILSGFSFGPTVVRTPKEAAKDIWKFMQVFLSNEEFSWLQDHQFYIATESFGARFAPVFANYFLHKNRKIDEGREGVKIPVSGLAISNGKHDPLIQMGSAMEFARDAPGYGSLVDDDTLQNVTKAWENVCKPALEECYEKDEDTQCSQALKDCTADVLIPSAGERDLSDLRVDAETAKTAKLPPKSYVRFIRSKEVKNLIGADTRFDQCNHTVKARFARAGETGRSYLPPLAKLLDAKIPTLIWAGDADIKSNWIGIHDSMVAMNWYGNETLKNMEFQNLTIGGDAVASYKAVDNFTFARVFGAGHSMPSYQPKVALEIFSQFLVTRGRSLADAKSKADSNSGLWMRETMQQPLLYFTFIIGSLLFSIA